MQYLPILISLFLQSPIGGQPRLLLSSSSRYSNGRAGPLTLSLYNGSKRLKKSSSKTNTWKLQKHFCSLSQGFKRPYTFKNLFTSLIFLTYLPKVTPDQIDHHSSNNGQLVYHVWWLHHIQPFLKIFCIKQSYEYRCCYSSNKPNCHDSFNDTKNLVSIYLNFDRFLVSSEISNEHFKGLITLNFFIIFVLSS